MGETVFSKRGKERHYPRLPRRTDNARWVTKKEMEEILAEQKKAKEEGEQG